MKELLHATIDRVARRVCLDARNTSKKSAKFAAWVDGKSHEHRALFRDQILLVTRVIDEKSANATAVALDGQFFSHLNELLSPLILPPFAIDELAANVDARCTAFESMIAEKLTNLVFAKE